MRTKDCARFCSLRATRTAKSVTRIKRGNTRRRAGLFCHGYKRKGPLIGGALDFCEAGGSVSGCRQKGLRLTEESAGDFGDVPALEAGNLQFVVWKLVIVVSWPPCC